VIVGRGGGVVSGGEAGLPAFLPRGSGDFPAGSHDPSFTRWLPLQFSPRVTSQPFRTRAGALPLPWGNVNCAYSLAIRRDPNRDLNGQALFSFSISAGAAPAGGFVPYYAITDANSARLVFSQSLGAHGDVRSTLTQLPGGLFQLSSAGPPGALARRGRYTYTFEPLDPATGAGGRLVSIADDLGNQHVCAWQTGQNFLTVTDSSSGRQLVFRSGADGYLATVDAPVYGGTNPAVRKGVRFDAAGHLLEVKVFAGGTSTPAHTDAFTYGGPNGDSVTSAAQGVSIARQTFAASQATDPFGLAFPRLGSSTAGDAGDTSSSDDGGSVASSFQLSFGQERWNGGVGLDTRTNTFTDARGYTSRLIYSFGADPFSNRVEGAIKSLLAIGPDFAGTPAANGNQWKSIFLPDVNHPTQITVSDPVGRTWDTRLDTFGNVLFATDPLGHRAQFGYSADGLDLTSVTDATNLTARFGYGPGGRVTSVTDPAGTQQAGLVYNTFGQPTQVTTPVGTTRLDYHALTGDLLRVTGPSGDAATINDYDALGDPLGFSVFPDTGNPLTSQTPLTTTIGYDAAQQVREVVLPNGVRTENTWTNGVATRTLARAPNGSTLSQMDFGYDSRGRLYLASDLAGIAAQYRYDKNSNLTQLWDGRGNVTRFSFGANNEPTGVTWPDDAAAGVLYDGVGRVRRTTDERGIVKNYVFDAAGRLIRIKLPATPGRTVSYAYDDAGRPLTISDASGNSVVFAYDHPNKWLTGVTTTQNGRAYTLSYTYLPDGRRQTMTSPVGVTTYGYDPAGRPASLSSPFGETTAWAYDHIGRLLNQSTSTGAATLATAYAYGRSGQYNATDTAPVYLSNIAQTVNGQPFWTYQLRHTILGQLTNQSGYSGPAYPDQQINDALIYDYDARGRFHSDTVRAWRSNSNPTIFAARLVALYDHDLAGNLDGNARGWIYNANNQVTTAPAAYGLAGASGLSHDAAGNLTGANGMALAWDPWGQLDRVENTASGTVTFTYDLLGRRATKTVAGQTTYFLYDGSALVAEMNGATGQITRSYTWGVSGLVSDRARVLARV